jgi:hypothetical protein
MLTGIGVNKVHMQPGLILPLMLLGMSLIACDMLKGIPAINSTPPAATSIPLGTVPLPTSAALEATSAISPRNPVLVRDYQLGFIDACHTLAYKSLYTPPIEEWTTAPNGYHFLFTYLLIQEKGNPSPVTPDLPSSSFSVIDVHGAKYRAMNSSIEGACNTDEPMHHCSRDGKLFNMLVMFTVPEKLVNERWRFLFKDAEAFPFRVSQNTLCPARDRQ